MSRIGNQPVAVPSGVTVTVNNDQLVVKGPKGQLQQKIVGGIAFDVQADVVKVNRENDSKPFRANHGLMRALLNNMVTGVTVGEGIGQAFQMRTVIPSPAAVRCHIF